MNKLADRETINSLSSAEYIDRYNGLHPHYRKSQNIIDSHRYSANYNIQNIVPYTKNLNNESSSSKFSHNSNLPQNKIKKIKFIDSLDDNMTNPLKKKRCFALADRRQDEQQKQRILQVRDSNEGSDKQKNRHRKQIAINRMYGNKQLIRSNSHSGFYSQFSRQQSLQSINNSAQNRGRIMGFSLAKKQKIPRNQLASLDFVTDSNNQESNTIKYKNCQNQLIYNRNLHNCSGLHKCKESNHNCSGLHKCKENNHISKQQSQK